MWAPNNRIKQLPEISYPTEQVVGPIPEGHQGVGAKEDGLRPVGWFGEFGKHYSCQAGLDNAVLQCSTVQCSTAQYSKVQYSAVQCSTAQYSKVQ